MSFLSRMGGYIGRGANMFANGVQAYNDFNNKISGAVPGLQVGAESGDGIGSHIMNKYGRPIAQAIDST
jgi:hypothetical protein